MHTCTASVPASLHLCDDDDLYRSHSNMRYLNMHTKSLLYKLSWWCNAMNSWTMYCYIHTHIHIWVQVNLLYVSLAFGARSGSPQIMHIYTCTCIILVNPLPYGKILRMVCIGMSWLKHASTFFKGDKIWGAAKFWGSAVITYDSAEFNSGARGCFCPLPWQLTCLITLRACARGKAIGSVRLSIRLSVT